MKPVGYIIVDSLPLMKLKECLTSLLEFYSLDTGIQFISVHSTAHSDNQYIVTFPILPDFERFRYFVNFLTYPVIKEGLSSPPKVVGFYTEQENPKQSVQTEAKRWMIYVPENDTEFDMVYGVYASASATTKFPFSLQERTEKLSFKQFDFVEPQIDFDKLSLVATVHAPEGLEKEKSGCFGALTVSLTILISLAILLT